jgi:hypothetical protein
MATTINVAYAQAVADSILQPSYVALLRQDGSECPAGRIPFGMAVVDAVSDPNYIVISNLDEIVFPLVATDVAPLDNPVVQMALYDASSYGNLLATTDIVAKPYLAGDQFRIPSGWLQFKIQKVV